MRKFNNSFPGYNKNEVNSFVKNVTTEYERLLNNLKARDQEIEKLNKELVHYKNIESTLNRTLLIAEESTQNIKKAAFEEAKIIIEDSKKNASRIINNALIKAEKVESEANNLKKQVMMYKRKYRNVLEQSIEELEKFDLDN